MKIDRALALRAAARELFEAQQRVSYRKQLWADECAADQWAALHESPPVAGDFVVDPAGYWCLWQSTDANGVQLWGYAWS